MIIDHLPGNETGDRQQVIEEHAEVSNDQSIIPETNNDQKEPKVVEQSQHRDSVSKNTIISEMAGVDDNDSLGKPSA